MQLLNFKRAGPLSDFRIKELDGGRPLTTQAKDDAKSGSMFACQVKSGKTFKAHGAAQLAMPETFAETLKLYCKYIRPFTDKDNDYVFTYRSGKWLDSSEMNKQLQSAWEEYCCLESKNKKLTKAQRAWFAKTPRLTSSILRRSIMTQLQLLMQPSCMKYISGWVLTPGRFPFNCKSGKNIRTTFIFMR